MHSDCFICNDTSLILSPLAHRFHLGFTLISETLFLSSVKSRLMAEVTETKERRTKEEINPALQSFMKTFFIPLNVLDTRPDDS